MNSLIGAKLSIVTPKPQTTRKRVLGILTDEDSQIIFLDTPGMLKPRYELQKSMMNYVDDSLSSCDIIATMIDATKFSSVERCFPENFFETIKNIKKPKFLIINKVDSVIDKKEILPIINAFNALNIFDEFLPISALKSDSLDILIKIFKQYLPQSEFFYEPDLLSTQPERFFVSEIIRQNIFMSFSEEVPYSTEVIISEFKERQRGKWFISADIIVERPTQKAILIGAKGEKIKSLGEKSRSDIEEHLGMSIFLELFVKVRDNWRDNKSMLKNLGY